MLNTNSFDFSMFAAAASGQKVSTASKAWDATKSATGKAVDAVKGVAPVTNNKFDKYLGQVDSRLDAHDEQLWKLEFLIHHIANQKGVALPADELVKEFYMDFRKEEAEKAKALATNTTPVAPAVSDEDVIDRIKKMLFGTPEEVKKEMEKPAQLESKEEIDAYFQEDVKTVEEAKQFVKQSTGVTEDVEEAPPAAYTPDVVVTAPPVEEVKPEPKVEMPAPTGFKACAGGCGRGLRADYASDKCSICRKEERDSNKVEEPVTVPSEPVAGADIPDEAFKPRLRHRIRFDD